MRISDWSSDVCSSDLLNRKYGDAVQPATGPIRADLLGNMWAQEWGKIYDVVAPPGSGDLGYDVTDLLVANKYDPRSEEHTSELQSLMRISSAVFCLKKQKNYFAN